MRHIFVDDGQPEASDFADNYQFISQRPAIARRRPDSDFRSSNRWKFFGRFFQRLEIRAGAHPQPCRRVS